MKYRVLHQTVTTLGQGLQLIDSDFLAESEFDAVERVDVHHGALILWGPHREGAPNGPLVAFAHGQWLRCDPVVM